MVGIVLEGEAAAAERQRLLTEGREVSMNLWERDTRGKEKTTCFQFGVGGGVGWVFYQAKDKGMEPQVVLEEVLVHEVAELFRSYLDRIELRRCLVDPSPLSPAFVEISPCIQDAIAALEAEFGISVALS